MVTTPLGKISTKATANQTWKRKIRIEKIARLSKDAILTNAQIANHLNVTLDTVTKMKQTVEYQRAMIHLSTGVMENLEVDIETMKKNSLEELASLLPAALYQLRNCLLSKNENIKMKAITEILDREGTNAKVSKVNVKHEAGVDLSKTNSTAMDIMALLGRPVGEELDEIEIAGGFTVNAAQATTQVKQMSEVIDEKTLEELDLSMQKKQ